MEDDGKQLKGGHAQAGKSTTRVRRNYNIVVVRYHTHLCLIPG